jgi:surface antigen
MPPGFRERATAQMAQPTAGSERAQDQVRPSMTFEKITQVSATLMFCMSLSLAAAPSAHGAGLNDPFGRESYHLSEADWELLKQSVREVLEAQKQGATADWAGKQSGRAGRATLLRAFERDSMPCGEVEHVFTAGGGNRYVLPFCRIGDGTWKVAF